MKKLLLFSILCCLGNIIFAQNYTLKNAHSHNDYEQKVPFWYALGAGVSSIEADVFLVNNQLYVSHEEKDIQKSRTFESLYLEWPAQNAVYADIVVFSSIFQPWTDGESCT